MQSRNVKILGTGCYLPEKVVYSHQLDERLGKEGGTVEEKSGATKRHFVENETIVEMGVKAAEMALFKAGISKNCIDLIIFASVSRNKLIPNTAALIQKALGLEESSIPGIDIQSVCLSFVTALDMVSYLVHAGGYKNVLIVSSEIASIGLDWNDLDTCTIFGDGAAAAVISQSIEGMGSKILGSHMETYTQGIDYGELGMPALFGNDEFVFRMKGKESFRLVLEKIDPFLESLFTKAGVTWNDIDLVIPHQASQAGLRLLQRRLDVPDEKWMNIFSTHANQISVSIPTALHRAIEEGKVKRGDKILLVGSAAGIALGGIVLEY